MRSRGCRDATGTHLPFLSLFQRRIMLDVLSHMTEERAYAQIVGDDLTAGASRSLLSPEGGMQSTGRSYAACRTMLRAAHAAGFLESISPSVYQINPSMPWFLGRKLGRQVSGNGIQQLEMEFVRVYADTADYFMESLYENQDTGVTAVLAEEGNLTQALGLALEYRQWDNAQVLFQPLAQVYRMQKRFPELRRLRGQLLDTIGHTAGEAGKQRGHRVLAIPAGHRRDGICRADGSGARRPFQPATAGLPA